MNYSEIVKTVAEEIDLPKEIVDKTYKAYWKCIKAKIQSLPLKDQLNQEQFSQLNPNINIPSLGKLSISWDRYIGIKKKYETLKDINYVEDKED